MEINTGRDYYSMYVSVYESINPNSGESTPETPETPETSGFNWAQFVPKTRPSHLTANHIEGYFFCLGAELIVENGEIKPRRLVNTAPHWLVDGLTEHASDMLPYFTKRQAAASLFERIEFLKHYETKGNKPRQDLIDYLAKQIVRFGSSCDLEKGYTDPYDPFAATALETLEAAFIELTRPGNPYPLRRDSG